MDALPTRQSRVVGPEKVAEIANAMTQNSHASVSSAASVLPNQPSQKHRTSFPEWYAGNTRIEYCTHRSHVPLHALAQGREYGHSEGKANLYGEVYYLL